MAIEPKSSFMLVNEPGQNALDVRFGDPPNADSISYIDVDVDGNGALRVTKGAEQALQVTLKAIFTEKQPNGQGSNVFTYIGEKDIAVRRLGLFMDVSTCIMALKAVNDAQVARQNLTSADTIATVGKLVVTEPADNPAMSKIELRLILNSDQQVDINVA